MISCRDCVRPLTIYNWFKSSRLKGDKICKRCRSLKYTQYRKEYYINNKDRIAVKNMIYRLKQKAKLTEEV